MCTLSSRRTRSVVLWGLVALGWIGGPAAHAAHVSPADQRVVLPPGRQVGSLEEAIGLVKAQHAGRVTAARIDCDPGAACRYLITLRADDGLLTDFEVAAPGEAPLASPQASDTAAPDAPPAAPLALKPSSFSEQTRAEWGVFLTLGAGQIAGLGNVILDPLVQPGVTLHLSDSRWPAWEADGSFRLIYGRTESTDPATLGTKTSKPALQEYRGQAHVIYNYERDGDAAKAGVGLYVDMARPIRSSPRYTPPEANDAYAAEEGEIAGTIFDTGLDFRFALHEQRVASVLDNVVFINGSRIAPNLLTYKPMLGFMWHNQFAITGSIGQPGWSFSTDVDFYFARKAGVRYFNGHDGLGGTKRELDLSYGVSYQFDAADALSVKSYGYNNLNRGSSSMVPVGFKDGLRVTMSHQFN